MSGAERCDEILRMIDEVLGADAAEVGIRPKLADRNGSEWSCER